MSRSAATQKFAPPALRTVARPDSRSARKNGSHSTHRWHNDQRQQRIVQLFGVANRRPGFRRHLGNRRWIERGDAVGVGSDRPPHLDRAGASLLERRIVQIGVRIRVQNLVREG